VAFAALGVTLLALPAVADAQTRQGDFSCRASALRVGPPVNSEPTVANSSGPCEDELSQLADVTAGPAAATALKAETKMTPDNPQTVPPAAGDNGVADALVATADIDVGPGISAEVLRATAQVVCGPFHPTLESFSSVAVLKLGGMTVPVTQQQAIPLLVGFLRVNWTVNEPGKVTRRALWVDLAPSGTMTTGDPAGPDIIVSEAIADFEGNPCLAAEPKPQCSNGIDDDGDGFIDFPADPGCSGPDDNNETDPTPKPQCSNGIDDDGDGRVDFGPNPFHDERPETGCTGPDDPDESGGPPPPPECSNGIDDDGDGRVDFGPNPFHDERPETGCTGPDDPDESA
jgi:hypothetical protein